MIRVDIIDISLFSCSAEKDFLSAIVAEYNVYLIILTFATLANGVIGSVSIRARMYCRTKTSASPGIARSSIVVEQIREQVDGLKLSARARNSESKSYFLKNSARLLKEKKSCSRKNSQMSRLLATESRCSFRNDFMTMLFSLSFFIFTRLTRF